MPTKRSRRSRRLEPAITATAIEAFRIAEARSEQYHACVRGRCAVPDRDPGVHCASCGEYLDASRRLIRELQILPHEPCPAWRDIEGFDPTDESNRRSQELRVALLAAAGMEG